MKQKVAIISAVMNKPKFLVLDEPTNGLDPIMQKQFNALIGKLKEDYETTVIICSHIFEEVIELCDKVAFIKEGKIVEQFDVKEKDINSLNEKFNEIYERKSKLQWK